MTLTSWKNKGEGNAKSAEGSISTAEAQVECSLDVLIADPELGRETGARNQGWRHTHPPEGRGHSDEMQETRGSARTPEKPGQGSGGGHKPERLDGGRSQESAAQTLSEGQLYQETGGVLKGHPELGANRCHFS